MTVHELSRISVMESGVCQICGGPAHLESVVRPTSSVLLEGNIYYDTGEFRFFLHIIRQVT